MPAVRNRRLAYSRGQRNDDSVWRKPTVVREDVNTILAVLFDIKRELVRIREALQEEDDGEEED
jgi:hypothetical protein